MAAMVHFVTFSVRVVERGGIVYTVYTESMMLEVETLLECGISQSLLYPLLCVKPGLFNPLNADSVLIRTRILSCERG